MRKFFFEGRRKRKEAGKTASIARRLPWRLDATNLLRMTGRRARRVCGVRADKKANTPLPSASPPPSPQGEGKTFIIPNKYAKRGKTTLLPLFPYICLFSLISIRMEVNAARIKKGRAPKGAPQRGETAAEPSKDGERQVSPFLSTICFDISKQIVRTKILEKGKITLLPFLPYSEELHGER